MSETTESVSSPGETSVDKKVRQDVVKFLRDLADKLEHDDLSPEACLRISEFFMKYNFINAIFDDTEDTNTSTDESDILKFMSLGWYVYTQLIPRATQESQKEK